MLFIEFYDRKNMYNKKTVILFVFFTLMFTWVFFALDTFIFSKKYHPEERYMEKSLFLDEKEEIINWDYLQIAKDILKEKTRDEIIKERIQKRKKLILEHIEEENETRRVELKEKELEIKIKREVELRQKEIDRLYNLSLNNKTWKENSISSKIELTKRVIPEIEFNFVPNYFSNNNNTWKKDVYKVINSKVIYNFINELNVVFYKNRADVRGRMKNKSVFLYAPQKMKKDELLAIFIHEFSHYLDIYTFNRSTWKDVSNKFYDISWASTKIIKSWLSWKDFVSGYSMTNKYEDFAESLTYYILHNKDFIIKTRNSIILQKKYNFFKNTLFNSLEFVNTDFSKSNKIKNYYRDITKINFSTKNFLQYLKKSI